MRKKVLVAQSGGPTVAINASLAGVIAGITQSESMKCLGLPMALWVCWTRVLLIFQSFRRM